jgi:hypothetical protein
MLPSSSLLTLAIAAVNSESVEVVIPPSHRNLQNVVKVFDGVIPAHRNLSPDHRADADEGDVELIGRRGTWFKHPLMIQHCSC